MSLVFSLFILDGFAVSKRSFQIVIFACLEFREEMSQKCEFRSHLHRDIN